MPRRCRLCALDPALRSQVDAAIIAGTSWMRIAQRFDVSAATVGRHKKHILTQVAEAAVRKQKETARYGSDLVARVESLYTKTTALLDQAQSAGSLMTALRAISEAREHLKLLAHLTGELAQANTTNITLINSPEWSALSQKILKALERHPEARLDVLRALGTNIPMLALPASVGIEIEDERE